MTARRWTIAAGVVVIVVLVVHLALPSVLQALIVRQLEGLTGEPAAVGTVEVNLFTGRLVLHDVRLGAADEAIAWLERLQARFAVAPLLRAHLRLTQASADGLVVRVVRAPTGEVNVAPALERLSAPGAGEARYDLTVEHGWIRNAQVTVEDRAVTPARTWDAVDIHIGLDQVSTLSRAPGGLAYAVATLAGAPARMVAEDVGLRPLRAQALLQVIGLDASVAGLYMAEAGAPVVIGAGRGTARWRVVYDGAGARGTGQVTVAGLVLEGAETGAPIMTAPLLTLASTDVRYRDGIVSVARVEARSRATSVFDPRADERIAFDLGDVRAAVENLTYPSTVPADVTLTGGLPEGGRIEIQGQATLEPTALDLTVSVRGGQLAPFRRYVPPDAPLTFQGGAVGGTVRVRYDTADGLLASGTVTVRDLEVYRRGQRPAFIRHRELRTELQGLRVVNGAVNVERLALSGAPVMVDASVSPPQRFDLQALSLVMEGAGWPWRGPAHLSGEAELARGGRARLDGELTVAPFTADVRLDARDFDLPVVNAYLGPDRAVEFRSGRLQAVLNLAYGADSVVHVSGQGVVTTTAVARPGDAAPFVEAPRVAFSVTELRVREGEATAATLTVEGAPTFRDPTSARSLHLRRLRGELRDLAWPGRAAAARLEADLAEAGTLTATGRVDLGDQSFTARAEVSDAALAPLAAFMPGPAALSGEVSATLDLRGTFADFRVSARGDGVARDVALGPPDRPPIEVAEIAVRGLDAEWPERIHVGEVVVRRPSVFLERSEDGDFPVVAMLRPAASDAPAASPATAGEPRTGVGIPEPAFALSIGRIALAEGDVRFIDRTTRPFYSEELTELDVTIEGLTTEEGRAKVRIEGLLGADAVLQLTGVVAPFAEPFFLEVQGELTRFQVPRTNPYLRRLFEAVATRGQLTTELHYRVTGRELRGTNEVFVEQLNVERARSDEVDRVIGLPLALVVSVLKNPGGDIRLRIPVAGDITSPEFSLGDAIVTALRNTLARVVTAPFRGIARVFQRDGVVQDVAVEPVTFPPGEAEVTPGTARHLQRVADVLRASPYVRMALWGVATDADDAALRALAASRRIARLQREQGIENFTAAAMRLFRARYPDRTVPADLDRLVAALADDEAASEAMAARLAERRANAVQQTLVDGSGIEPSRLVVREPVTDARGTGRVALELLPEG